MMRGDLGFISCKVAEGDHELVLSFHTPMVMQGILVAVIFWCLYAVMLYADKKRRKAVQKI